MNDIRKTIDKIKTIMETEDEVSEVAPPGGEKVVKALKRNKDVDNPYAVAWSMKNKGDEFSEEEELDEDDYDGWDEEAWDYSGEY